jgi:lipopolysaccharide transport protein LptA
MFLRNTAALAVLFTFLLGMCPSAAAQAAPGAEAEEGPVRIKARRMTADMNKREILAEGDVYITRASMILESDRAIAYLGEKTDSEDLVQSITKVEAMGSVRITDKVHLVTGRGAKCVYDRKTEVVELLGPPRPSVARGESVYLADRIVYNRRTGKFLLDGNSEVEIRQIETPKDESREEPPARSRRPEPAPAPAVRAREDGVRLGG